MYLVKLLSPANILQETQKCDSLEDVLGWVSFWLSYTDERYTIEIEGDNV